MNKPMWTNPAVWEDGTPRSQGNAFDWQARLPSRRPARKRSKPQKSLRERKRQALLNL